MNELSTLNINTNETYMSFNATTQDEKIKLYNAINVPDYKLSDFINKSISVRDVIIMGVEINREVNPFDKSDFDSVDEKRKANRVILIDMDGKSYAATSDGISNAVRTLMNVFGSLHFEDGLNVTVKQVNVKRGSLLTLSL